MKKTTLAIAVLLIAVHSTCAQDVQVNGKTLQTVKKTVLNAETGYYQLKEKGKRDAQQESYIKTGGKFHKTVFTEAELKNFFNNGKISSLGKMEKAIFRDSMKISYIDKGSKKILFSIKGNQLNVFEYFGEVKDLFSSLENDDEDNRPEGELKDCEDGCMGRKYDECEEEFGVGNDVCFNDMILCIIRCRKAFDRTKGLVNYTLSVNAVKITR